MGCEPVRRVCGVGSRGVRDAVLCASTIRKTFSTPIISRPTSMIPSARLITSSKLNSSRSSSLGARDQPSSSATATPPCQHPIHSVGVRRTHEGDPNPACERGAEGSPTVGVGDIRPKRCTGLEESESVAVFGDGFDWSLGSGLRQAGSNGRTNGTRQSPPQRTP